MRSLILGHRGMVGSAISRLLPDAEDFYRCMDLCAPLSPKAYMFDQSAPFDAVYLCAARVGGIQRNIAEPGAMIYDNLMIQANVIEAARVAGVKLIVFLGSSCIYPKYPDVLGGWTEEELMCGPLEPTNEPYAIAKIAGIKMLEAYQRQYGMEFLAPMPCNLYGPGDNYDPDNSHFLPAMIRKLHEAKVSGAESVTLWGTGAPRRELMHVDDCARIIVELVEKGARGIVNVGWGSDTRIRDWAELVAGIVGYKGLIEWDHSRPDGVMGKLLDVGRMRSFGCNPQILPTDGIRATYEDFLKRLH